MLRSFLAIELPKPILNKIEEVQADLRSTHADVRWVSPEKIHLTLKFFGNIEESKIETIVQSMDEPIRVTSPFLLTVRGMGAFPHFKNPRVIWVRMAGGEEKLTSFQRQLESQFEKIGFEGEDRSFHPHLTLGRAKSNRGKEELIRTIEKHKEDEFGDIQVERMILFKSELKPSGPIYTPLREMKLGGL
ncbi:MAG: 2'-5' RNA ligase [Deltaproteobacteria bacterium RBG_13_47_9]|nr:MAG: 2'-5' RNA ligase [Deltaproteobacteria bacterium RBG_13_47_9]